MKRTVVLWSIGVLLAGFTAVMQLRDGRTIAVAGIVNEPPAIGGEPGGAQARVVLDLDGVATLTAALESTHVLYGQPGDLALNLAVSARQNDGAGARVPIDLVLVLDRSGSMEGDKLLFAKQAAQRLVERLRPGDRVALVSYATDVTVHAGLVASEDARGIISGAIWGITAEGSTSIDGGLSSAVDLLAPEASAGRAQRVILISDGEANVGRTTLEALSPIASGAAERGVSVTTIGVGLSFNEPLLMGLASSGAGNYHYVRDGQGLAGAFLQELDRLKSTVARAAMVEVTPAPGVIIADVAGHTFERAGDVVRIRVGDLFGGAQRKVLVRLRLAPGALGLQTAARVRLQVEDPRSARAVSASADLGVTVTDRVAAVENGRDPEVAAALAEVRTAERLSSAIDLYESGNVAAASAALRGFADQLSAQGRAATGASGARMLESARRLYTAEQAVLAAPAASSDDGRDLARRSRAEARELAH